MEPKGLRILRERSTKKAALKTTSIADVGHKCLLDLCPDKFCDTLLAKLGSDDDVQRAMCSV